ncbi:MAG: type II secretion system F family protein [Candidatus Coprovivens sp.]
MDKYRLVLQIFAILFILYLGYLFIKLISALFKKNRLAEFSLELDNNKDKSFFFNCIFKFSNFLNSMVIFNSLAKTYDKYIYEDSRIKKGMDYVSIKIILGLLLMLLYLFIIVLYGDIFNGIILLCCFVIGFILPDFYCLFIKKRRVTFLNRNLLNVVIIMSNSYKAFGSIEKAINDVIDRTDSKIEFEFKKVLNDINMGIDISKAFYRMYQRVNSKSILYISRVFELVNKSGININEAFSVLESKLIEEEKFNNELNAVKSINKLSLIIFMIIPFIFIICLILYNIRFINIFTGYIGSFVIAIILILYLFYLIVIHEIYRGGKND